MHDCIIVYPLMAFLVEILQAFLVSNSVTPFIANFELLKTFRHKAIKVAGSEVVTHRSPMGGPWRPNSQERKELELEMSGVEPDKKMIEASE